MSCVCVCVCVCARARALACAYVCVKKFSLQTHTSHNWLTMKQDAYVMNEKERVRGVGGCWCIWLHRELTRGKPEGNGASVLLSIFSWFNGRLWISNGTKNRNPLVRNWKVMIWSVNGKTLEYSVKRSLVCWLQTNTCIWHQSGKVHSRGTYNFSDIFNKAHLGVIFI